MDEKALIEVRDLTHTYPQGAGRVALRNIGFEVNQGEIFGLLGPNGGGKTTAFRILTTLLIPSSGAVRVFGQDVQQQSASLRRRIGVVFQSQSLDVKLTVEENLRHHGHLYGFAGKNLSQRIESSLTRMGLKEREKDMVETLSGGLQRRLELAKAFLHEPELLLLDEPTTGLDPGARQDLWQYLTGLQDQNNVTILLTTHLLDEAEKCSRVVILDEGRIVAAGTPRSLREKMGGEILVIESDDPGKLQKALENKLNLASTRLGNTLRLQVTQKDRNAKGHEFIAEVMDAFGEEIRSVTLAKPTLEDVFIQATGHQFWSFAQKRNEGGTQ